MAEETKGASAAKPVSKIASIAGQAYRAISAYARVLSKTLLPEIPLWSQFSRIGGGIGPSEVSSILREADTGRPARLVDLVHECRQKDGHLQATLGVRELAVAGLKWGIEPPPEADETEKRCAAQCEAAVRASSGFHVLLAHLTGEGCLFPTGAWAEIVWGVSTERDSLGLEVPLYTKPISCRRFGFKRSDGKLVFVEYGKDPETSGVDLLEEYGPGNFIVRRPRVNGDVPAREGLACVITWDAVFRNWGVRDWLACGEMSWRPWRIASYAKEIESESRTAAEEALANLTATGSALLPNTVEMKVEWPKATGSGTQGVHRELCEFFGQEISKAVLGQTLTTEAGSRGARSLGQVHDAIRRDVREDDAVDVAAALDQYMITPFYQFNWGEGVRRGHFVFYTEDGVDMTTLADVIQKIAPFVDIPQAWVRNELGAPEPKDGEPICQERATAGTDPSGGGDTDTDESEDDDEQDDAA
jgi:phage gp29-like protein